MKGGRLYFDEICQVDFSILSCEEIRKISVKQIVNPNVFDELGNPTLDGPCSPELGPMKNGERCLTCGMGWLSCPGHYGHVELPMHIYNPITFKTVMQILGSTCIYCYELRITPLQYKITEAKLILLRTGHTDEINEIDNIVASSSSEELTLNGNKLLPKNEEDDSNLIETDNENTMPINNDITSAYSKKIIEKIDFFLNKILGSYSPTSKSHKIFRNCTNSKVSYAISELERSFLKYISQICPNCNIYNPTYYEFKNLKIFQKPIPSKQYKNAVLQCVNFKDILYGPHAYNSLVVCENIRDDGIPPSSNIYLDSDKVFRRIKKICENDKGILALMYGFYDSNKMNYFISAEYLFLDVLCVTPNIFRPFSKLHDKIFVHPKNVFICDILKDIHNIQKLCSDKNMKGLVDAVIKLQYDINVLYDSSKSNSYKKDKIPPGIRQVLEKKDGLIRKHMMGKRVNYSARSVISPDPNIDCNEIGLPYVFATKLTYTEPVTYFNVERLRTAVINGPHKWPGATHVQTDSNTLLSLETFDEAGRKSIASQLLTPINNPGQTFQQKVHRHILTGDFILFNRQPTLHKPSIMCHTARILPNEKTIRLNYVNCNTYNADFDGDEMNVHFPQDEVARAEAMLIARTDKQYIGPANGDVLRGLVQDHICAGVLMCSRNVFFNRMEYVQLVYDSLRPERDQDLEEGDHNVEFRNKSYSSERITLMTPAIISPVPRWTGKQVISTIISNTLKGLLPLNMTSKVSLSAKQIEINDSEDLNVTFIDGDMLTGYMDKSQLGAKTYGTMYSIYEVYGPYYSEKLLSSLGKLFTAYLQSVGFSCRLKDLRLDSVGNKLRRAGIEESENMGVKVMSDFLSEYKYKCIIEENSSHPDNETISNIIESTEDENMKDELETLMKTSSNRSTSKIISNCIPGNLLVTFPKNSMQVMTLSGAKGSLINAAQISVLLGQQELEGKRVPIMLSGKSLPSFLPYDTSLRAGGFISDRFLTGIRPQEYYFHCMAGREGLIDTAVKTSRSGYLQRCLVKHLEDIKVEYDGTVRSGDGSVIQFAYGEDYLDVTKSKSLLKFDFCAINYMSYLMRYNPHKLLKSNVDTTSVEKYIEKKKKKNLSRGILFDQFSPYKYLGAVSELFNNELSDYINNNPNKYLHRKKEPPQRNTISAKNFELLMKLKYQMSLVEPGEPVGLLAAQSIGEPSTQMTLNTFHLAGFGAKNITLGVPRLQEVIMMALRKSKTPIMKLEIKDSSEDTAMHICNQLNRLCLWDIIEKAFVEESITKYGNDSDLYCRRYLIKFHFFDSKICAERYNLTNEDIKHYLKFKFLALLSSYINKNINSSSKKSTSSSFLSTNSSQVAEDDTQENEHTKEVPMKEIKSNNESNEDIIMDVNHSDTESSSGSEIDESFVTKKETEDTSEFNNDTTSANLNEKPDDTVVYNQERFIYPRYVTNHKFYESNSLTSHIELKVSIENRLLIMPAIESLCKKAIIREVVGVSKCVLTPKESEMQKTVSVTTDGVNLSKIWEFRDYINIDSIYSNEISAILSTYGVEAARNAIVTEIKSVFSVYGINVSYRHLSLIADYITFGGGQRPLNRTGINTCPSPFSKMSFETTFTFLKSAAVLSDYDNLKTPSASLMVGKHVTLGTGSFDVLCPI